MNKTQTINHNGRELLCVGAKKKHIEAFLITDGTCLVLKDKNTCCDTVKLDRADYTILGFSDDEEVAKGIVEKVMGGQHYQNYVYIKLTDRWVRTAVESLSSLLKANGIFTENPIPPFKERFEDYKQAESQLWQKILILEVKK